MYIIMCSYVYMFLCYMHIIITIVYGMAKRDCSTTRLDQILKRDATQNDRNAARAPDGRFVMDGGATIGKPAL